jgi:uncharacterized protein YdgA (DUF945 family)
MAASVAKAGRIGGVVIAVLGGIWVAAGMAGSRAAEAQLRPMVDRPLGNGQWRLVNLQHQPGLVSATGAVDVRLEHALNGTGDGQVVARIEYRIEHLPLPSGLAQFHWTLKPVGEAADNMTKVLGPDFKMQGDGRVLWSGAVETDMRLPEIALGEPDDNLKITPTRGTLVVKGNALTVHWRLDRFEQSGQDGSISVEGVTADADLVDFKEGTGASSVAFDKIAATAGTIEGIKILAEAVDHDDRRDIRLTSSVATIQAADYNAKDLALVIAAKGLDRQSLKTLVALGNSLQPQARPTAEQVAVARAAAAALLKKGFSLSVPRLAGAVVTGLAGKPQNASIDAHIVFDLAPTTGAGLSLNSQLKSQGELTLAVSGLLKEQRQMALSQGLVTVTPDGLKADYALVDGKLTLNGQPYDPASVTMLLAMAEQQVNHFLDPLAFPLAQPAQGEDKAEPTEGEPDETQMQGASGQAGR